MAGYIELATLRAPVVADSKGFRAGMSIVKKEGKDTANEIEKEFQNSSKKSATYWDSASKKIQKSLKTTEQDAKELTKTAENIYKDGFGKSANDVVRSLIKTKRAMGDIDGAELETATKRALELRDAMGIKMSKSLKMAKQEMDTYGSSADQAFDRVEKRLEKNSAAWQKLGTVGDKIGTLGMALTAGVTTPIIGMGVAAVKTAADFESANAKIVGSLGLTEQQSAVTKKALQTIYSDGFGESIDDVADSIKEVKQQLDNIPDDQIVQVTESAMVLRDTLGQDMGESLRGINSLMKNFGMSAQDAMDLYVRGVQTGLDKTGELGDNLAEYGQLWAQAGFSAKDMFAVLDNGLKSGAYNLDKVNDFVKEFTISLNDGRIQDNLKSFSKGTRDVFGEFKKGKATAQDVFKSVVTDLENTTNQQDKLSLASTVWSALGEDNAMKIIESLNNVNGTYDNVAGSMDKVKKQQNETFGARTKTMFREAQTALLPLGETLLKLAERYMPQLEKSVATFSNTLSKVSPDDINNILKIGGFVAIAGPTVIGIGKVTKSIATVGDALKLGAGHLGLFQKSATLAGGAGGVGMLGTALTAVATPIGITTVAATALAGGLVYLVSKQEQARRETEKWGVKLSSTADNELSNFKGKVDKTKDAIDRFEAGSGSAAKVSESFKQMYSEIATTADKANKELEKVGARLGLTDEQIAKGKANNNQYVKNAELMSQQVIDIYQKHNNDSKQITSQEKEIVLNNQKEMINAQMDLLKLSGEEKKNVMIALNGDVNQLNRTQLEDATKHLETLMSKENEAYKKEKDDLKTALDSKAITQKDYDTKAAIARDQHNAVMESYGTKYLATMNALDRAMQASGMDKTATGIWQRTRDTLNQYGDGMYDKIISNSYKASQSVNESSGMIARYTAEMTTDGKAASDNWNALVFDPKTGELKQNADEEVKKALQAQGGWDQMQFILKNANLETNARIKIAEALVANGQWQNLNPAEKTLVVNNHRGLQAIFDSKESLKTWDSMPEQVKKILANNEDFLNKKEAAKAALDAWNKLTPKEQKLTAQNKAGQPTAEAQAVINSLLGKDVGLFATNNAFSGKDLAQGTVNSFLGKTVQLFADNSAGTGKGLAQSTVDSLTGKTVNLYAEDNTGLGVSAAQKTLNLIPSEKSVYLNFVNSGKPFANGTAYHRGGDAVVNDQPGPLYEELITLKNGVSFIPKGRNVVLPLPEGTRVDKAADTDRIMKSLPHFADGVNNQTPLPFVGYNAAFRKQDVSNSNSTTKVINNSPVININNPVWNSEKDIRKTLQDAAFILNIDERGSMNG